MYLNYNVLTKKGQVIMMKFTELMTEKMNERKITNYKLAKLTGINIPTIYKILTGVVSSPTLINAVKIAKVLDIDLNELKEKEE